MLGHQREQCTSSFEYHKTVLFDDRDLNKLGESAVFLAAFDQHGDDAARHSYAPDAEYD